MRLPVVTFVLLVLACSARADSFEEWGGPQVLVQPDSPVVVLLNVRIRDTVRHNPGHLFGSPTESVERSILQTTFQTLDVRSCVAGPVHSYDRSVDQFGWGAAPGEVWIEREGDAGAIELVGGGAQTLRILVSLWDSDLIVDDQTDGQLLFIGISVAATAQPRGRRRFEPRGPWSASAPDRNFPRARRFA